VTTRLTLRSPSVVAAGHTAAWVGVGAGSEWVQAGFAHDAGGGDVLYYEYKRPGDARATYVTLGAVRAGSTHTISVFESATRDSWRIRIDGRDRGGLVALPHSHGTYAPVATAENWDGGVGSCNAYAYAFGSLAVRASYGGAWQRFGPTRILRDPAYALTLRTNGFVASSR
jgi:hypothetical protein